MESKDQLPGIPILNQERKKGISEDILNIQIENLNLQTLTYNALKASNINILEDLILYTPSQLLKYRRIGEIGIENIKTQLKNKYNIIWEETFVKHNPFGTN